MTNRVAVIDLGTNTFHLLIAEAATTFLFREVHHTYEAVKLGEGGINKGTIKPEAYQRGLEALMRFKELIDQYQMKQVKALATSAMRCADNGNQFMTEVETLTGIKIEIISGEDEAGYIYQGVKASDCLRDEDSLIVDIGGGSVEFIIANQRRIVYKQSFEVGAARLMALFHQTDPIPTEQINDLHQYLDQQLEPVLSAIKQYPIQQLVGSSGAFETFAELIEVGKGLSFDLKQHQTYVFNYNDLLQILQKLIQSSHEQRSQMNGIIPVRVDMIVVAAIITNYLVKTLNLNKVIMSAYSLKEGVLAEMLKS